MSVVERWRLRLVGIVWPIVCVFVVGCGGGGGSGGGSGFDGTIYHQVAASDIDGDGLTDLAAIAVVYAAAGNSIEVQILLQNPANVGHFTVAQRLPLASYTGALTIADLDGDNWRDIVVSEPEPDRIRVFLQDAVAGHFTLHEQRPAAEHPTRVAVSDTDQDGAPDIIVAVNQGVLALRQDASMRGTFPFQTTIDGTEGGATALAVAYQSLAVGDLNDDGLPDVATVRADSGARIYFQSATTPGAFVPVRLGGMGLERPGAIAAGDIDADTFEDVALAGVTIKPVAPLRPQDSNTPGTFLAAYNVPIGDVGEPRAVAIADLTGDGLPDLVYGKSWVDHGIVDVWQQIGPPFELQRVGVFPVIKLAHNDGNLTSMVVADLNGDGLSDVAVVDGELSCLFNDRGSPGHLLPAVRVVQ